MKAKYLKRLKTTKAHTILKPSNKKKLKTEI